MKKSSIFMAAVLALVLALGGTALAQKPVINGIDANYPPFAYVDANGKPAGFDVESMDWIAKKMGFTVEHKPMDWDGIVPALLAKKIDMVCSGMSITEERKQKVNFSNPYWNVAQVFVAKKGSTITDNDILKAQKKLGVQRGTSEADELQKLKETKGYNYDLRFYDSAPLAIEDLLNGRIDAAAMDSLPAEDAMAKGKTIQVVAKFGEPENFGVAIRKEDADLLKKVNDGYKMLMADPQWQQLKDKYLKK